MQSLKRDDDIKLLCTPPESRRLSLDPGRACGSRVGRYQNREACRLPPLRGDRGTGCDTVVGGPALPCGGPAATQKHGDRLHDGLGHPNQGHCDGNVSSTANISNLYVAIHEEEEVLQYLACNWILFLKCFIDDGIGIWLHHPDPAEDERHWKEFQSVVARGGLAWDFSKRSNQIDFMDGTISLVDNRVEFRLFEKPLALHLYLPPYSCHPPGVIKGLVMGEVLRIFKLCSHDRAETSMITCRSSLDDY
ncbi:hypothetical protein THAOC_12523 [Thalassiosira oceanica]|uniref:Uncharacterized protein n=1 Tax=Thalassiosira oceanica TaxID=159749 RepID=K0SMF6_THAOC|nr:hypothetical protein THAOC_12523 [Thalassiosira oceanica]|eukprot:EJK66555.1 hypothetical protein THAOC_12523 [Thalassiosira oceanica]